jgi:hypothetical protein
LKNLHWANAESSATLTSMDLFEELRTLIHTLRGAALDYALCGGFALAAHGIVRATEDIDLMIEDADLAQLASAVQPLGFWLQPVPFVFHDGAITIRRFVKTGAPDFLILDVLMVTPATRPAWDTRRQLDTDFGSVPVVSRAGLIALKTLRGSGQDLDDIEKLKADEN